MRKFNLLDANLFRYKKEYLFQSLVSAGYILAIYLLLDYLREGWAIAPLAASTFIVFGFPHAKAAGPRYVIGGYFVAGVVGVLFSGVNTLWQGGEVARAHVFCCAAAMVIAMLLMVCLDFEHPPAAAMTITLVLTEDPLPVAITAFICVTVLVLVKQLIKRKLINL